MHCRTDIINHSLGWANLAIRHHFDGEHTVYTGSVDGRDYVTAPTREAAIQSLLRRTLIEFVR